MRQIASIAFGTSLAGRLVGNDLLARTFIRTGRSHHNHLSSATIPTLSALSASPALTQSESTVARSQRPMSSSATPTTPTSTSTSTLILNEANVKKVLNFDDCFEANRNAFMSLANLKANVPERVGLPSVSAVADATDEDVAEDWTLFKPAAFYGNPLHSPNAIAATGAGENDIDDDARTHMGLKVVSVRAQNPSHYGLPLVSATIMLLDVETGVTEAILAGTYLTVARTSAGPAIAVQLFRPDVQHLTVFGAGAQAECHIFMMESILQRRIPHITIINRSIGRAESLKNKVLQQSPSSGTEEPRIIETAVISDEASVAKAVESADVISTTTNSMTALWPDSVQVKPGCLITGIGSYTPEMTEVPKSAVDRSHVVLDTHGGLVVGDLKHLDLSKQQVDAWRRMQSQQQQQQQLSNDASETTETTEGLEDMHPVHLLGDVLLDRKQINEGKTPSLTIPAAGKDCVFYKSVGSAIQDVLTGQIVVDEARKYNSANPDSPIGQEVDLTEGW